MGKNAKTQGWSMLNEIGILLGLGGYFGTAFGRSVWKYLSKCKRYMSSDPKFLLLGSTPKKRLHMWTMVHV